MLTGKYSHSIDAKNRLIIPSKIKEQLGDTITILRGSDKVVYVRPEYEKNVFLLRDRKLVDGSAYCISYCNRPRTGTAYTVRYALQRGLKVFNASSFDVRSLK
jgi:hypothetical protein